MSTLPTFNWEEYFHLASELLKTPLSSISIEAQLRTSMSRAYYASFCKARTYLKKIGANAKLNSHKSVINAYSSSADPVMKKIGSLLSTLQQKRLDADYADQLTNIPFASKFAISLSQDIISQINNLDS